MAITIGWSLAFLGQLGIFYLLFRFLTQTRRKGVWFGVLIFPLLFDLWFGYELFLGDRSQLVPAVIAALVSALGVGLLWLLLPQTREAFTQFDQLRFEKEEVQLVLDHLPIFVVLKNLGSTYQKVNLTFAQMLGKAIDIVVGRSDADFFPPKIAQLFEEDQRRAVESKQVVSRTTELVTAKGKRWFEVTFTPIIDKLGMIRGVLVSGLDQTEVVGRTRHLETELHLHWLLIDVTRKMFACANETEIWDLLLEYVEKVASTAYVILALVAEDGNSLTIEKSKRADVIQVGSSIRSMTGLFGKVVRSGQMQTGERDADWQNLLRGEEAQELGWAVGIPVRLEGRVLGVVGLFYKQPEVELIEQRKEVLSEGAQIAELVLKEVRYQRELAQRIARTQRDLEQSALRQRIEHFLTALATRLVNATPPQIDSLLEKAIGSFAEYVGAEKSYVYLFKKEEGGLQANYRWAALGKLLPPVEILEPFDRLVSWVLERVNRQEIVLLSRWGEMPEGFQVYFDAQEIDWLVAVPMVLRRTVVGYFGLEGKQNPETVISDQIATVKAMADLIVNALDRKWSAEELEERMRLVGEKITLLEIRNQRSKLLTEMGDLLQSCRTADEAFPIVARYSQMLIPNSTGSLYLLRTLQDVAEKVAEWGNGSSGENELVLNECWGIRRGKVHIARDAEGPLCDHLGTPIPERYICLPLIAQGETIGLLHIRDKVGSAEDNLEEMSKIGMSIAEHVAPALSNLNLRDKLRSQAIRDPLTGLFNRRYMEETLDREIRRAARHKYSVGVIMIDIDQMKPINDRYGHDAGDVVLRQIGSLMKKIFRGEDVACRYGGDEFMIILPEASLSDVWQRAENLREMIKKTQFEYEGKLLGPVTVSIGVAAYPELGSTVERLIQMSDSAAYLAKREGGDRVMIARPAEENNSK